MDPDAILARIREAYQTALVGQGDTIEEDCAAYDAAEAVRDLDTWLSSGGFMPLAWQNHGGLKQPEGNPA